MTLNDIRLDAYYDKMEILKVGVNSFILFLRDMGTKTLKIFLVKIGNINITKFYHFSFEDIRMSFSNVKSFSVVPFNSDEKNKTALLNVLTTTDKQYTTLYEFTLSETVDEVQIINTWTINDDLTVPKTLTQDATSGINGFEISTENCYADLSVIDPKTKHYRVGCALSMGQSHVTEFPIISTGPSSTGKQRLRVYSNLYPIEGTLRANSKYVTYLAKSDNTSKTSPIIDSDTGDLLYDLSIMVFDKRCKTCVSATQIPPNETIEYIELFQAFPNAVKTAKLDINHLPAYELHDNFIFLNVNNKKDVYIQTFKINEDFSFMVYKDILDSAMGDILLKVNGEFGGYKEIKLDDMFESNDGSGKMTYLILWLIVGVVLVGLVVFIVVKCMMMKKKKRSSKVFQDQMEPILKESDGNIYNNNEIRI